ncbi:hypothetical protein BH23VER1_BH23VER1_07640 [soil metagenome]
MPDPENQWPDGHDPDLWRPDLHPIPEPFFSEETGAPFACCIECERSLAEMDGPYMVQKCSNGRETIFEFAICAPCAERLHRSYSEASRQSISRFFHSHVDLDARVRTLREGGSADLERWIGDCMTCGSPRRPGEGHATAALCAGADILFSHAPFRICSRCEIELNELVSPETRNEWDRFVGRNFDLPPSESLTPDRPGILMV